MPIFVFFTTVKNVKIGVLKMSALILAICQSSEKCHFSEFFSLKSYFKKLKNSTFFSKNAVFNRSIWLRSRRAILPTVDLRPQFRTLTFHFEISWFLVTRFLNNAKRHSDLKMKEGSEVWAVIFIKKLIFFVENVSKKKFFKTF